MKDKIKEIAKREGLTQTQVETLFKYQFKYVGDCITSSFGDVENAREIKIPYIGTFYPSIPAIKKIFEYHDKRKREDSSKAIAQDGHGT